MIDEKGMQQTLASIDRYINDRKMPKMMNYFKSRPELVHPLFELVKTNAKYPYAEYASWILVHIAAKKRFYKVYQSETCELFLHAGNQTILRNCSRALMYTGFPEEAEGLVLQKCTEILEDSTNNVAAQVNAIYLLIPIVKKHHELKNEILQLIEFHSRGKSSSYSAAFQKFIKKTGKI